MLENTGSVDVWNAKIASMVFGYIDFVELLKGSLQFRAFAVSLAGWFNEFGSKRVSTKRFPVAGGISFEINRRFFKFIQPVPEQ